MQSENFSQKEILLQLMTKLDKLSNAINNQDLMLTTISGASAGRDEKIKDLKEELKVLQIEVVDLTEKVHALKSFNKTIVAVWSGFILFISMFGKDIFNKLI